MNPYFNPDYQPYPPSVLIGTAIFFLIVSLSCVALRFYTRMKSMGQLKIDDWITIPSMLICVVLCILQIINTTHGGLSTHKTMTNGEFVLNSRIEVFSRVKYGYQVSGTIGLCVTKVAVLLYYRRIFSVRSFRMLNNVLIGITIAWGIAFTLVVIFQCNPISAFWTMFEHELPPYCIHVNTFYMSVAISDLILDVFIFTIPIPQLWKLKMPLRKKFAVGGVFLLGSIVVAIGIVRLLVFKWVIELIETKPMVYAADVLWYHPGTLFWHLAENVVALLGCCLPCYAPLVKGLNAKVRTLKGGSSANQAGSGSGFNSQGYPLKYHQRLDDEVPVFESLRSDSDDQFAMAKLPRV